MSLRSFIFLILSISLSQSALFRSRRGAYMSSSPSSPYSRPSYFEEQWNQNSYNPYQNWNQNPNMESWNRYGNQENQRGYSSYGRPFNYAPPQSNYGPPTSSYGRPEHSYSPYSRPTSSYERPQAYPAQPAPVVPPRVSPIVPPAPAPIPEPFPLTTSEPLFGGVEPGAGSLAPNDEEMTKVDAAEKENEVRKARGGPPGINVDTIVETGTLPPQAAIPEIPMPPSV